MDVHLTSEIHSFGCKKEPYIKEDLQNCSKLKTRKNKN